MNFKKLALSLTLSTCLIVGTIASAATFANTTTYDVSTQKVTLNTNLYGLTNGSMVTYVLYGPTDSEGAYSATHNEVTPDNSVAPTTENIIYVDQVNSVTNNSAKFGGTFDFGKVVGSSVLVGSDTDTITESDEGDSILLDQGIACFKFTAPTFGTDISAINLLATCADETQYSFDLATDETVNVPYGADLKITITTPTGYVCDSITLGDTEVEGTGNIFSVGSDEITVDESPITVGEMVTEVIMAPGTFHEVKKIISIDSNPYVDLTEHSVTFFITADAALVNSGIDLTMTNDADTIVVKDLKNLSTSDAATGRFYAIKVIDTAANSLIKAGTTYTAVPFYMDGANKVILTTSDTNSSYYTVGTEDAVITPAV